MWLKHTEEIGIWINSWKQRGKNPAIAEQIQKLLTAFSKVRFLTTVLNKPLLYSQSVSWDDNSQRCLLPVIKKYIYEGNYASNFQNCGGKKNSILYRELWWLKKKKSSLHATVVLTSMRTVTLFPQGLMKTGSFPPKFTDGRNEFTCTERIDVSEWKSTELEERRKQHSDW